MVNCAIVVEVDKNGRGPDRHMPKTANRFESAQEASWSAPASIENQSMASFPRADLRSRLPIIGMRRTKQDASTSTSAYFTYSIRAA